MRSKMSAMRRILLQKDLWSRSEEQAFKDESEWRILIHESPLSDSVIAYCRGSTAHWPTFATQSVKGGRILTISGLMHCKMSGDTQTKKPPRGGWSFVRNKVGSH